MYKFLILLSCLVCWTTADRSSLGRRLQFLNDVRTGLKTHLGYGQTPVTDLSAVQRQRFLFDVLLQVQRPLVNTQLIELGKVLIDSPEMYTQISDEFLLEFLEQARNQEILGRNDVYNGRDIQQVRQLTGLQRFLVLARDWPTFQRNVCFARLYVNPIMFVNALSLAVRDRTDTQGLVMPVINEILPQLYYDKDVLLSAQNANFNSLVTQTSNVRPTVWDIFGFRSTKVGSGGQEQIPYAGRRGIWRPWQELRLRLEGGVAMPTGSNVNTRNVAAAAVANSPESGIILPVIKQNILTNDIGLNILWNNIITDQLMQAVIESAQREQSVLGVQVEQLTNSDLGERIGIQTIKANRVQDGSPVEENIGVQGLLQQGGRQSSQYGVDSDSDSGNVGIQRRNEYITQGQNLEKEQIIGQNKVGTQRQVLNNKYRDVNGVLGEFPSGDVTNNDLLRVSRRKMNQIGNSNDRQGINEGVAGIIAIKETIASRQNNMYNNNQPEGSQTVNINQEWNDESIVKSRDQDQQERSDSFQQSGINVERSGNSPTNNILSIQRLKSNHRGEILLQSLQQLVARIKLEQIALNLERKEQQQQQRQQKQYNQGQQGQEQQYGEYDQQGLQQRFGQQESQEQRYGQQYGEQRRYNQQEQATDKQRQQKSQKEYRQEQQYSQVEQNQEKQYNQGQQGQEQQYGEYDQQGPQQRFGQQESQEQRYDGQQYGEQRRYNQQEQATDKQRQQKSQKEYRQEQQYSQVEQNQEQQYSQYDRQGGEQRYGLQEDQYGGQQGQQYNPKQQVGQQYNPKQQVGQQRYSQQEQSSQQLQGQNQQQEQQVQSRKQRRRQQQQEQQNQYGEQRSVQQQQQRFVSQQQEQQYEQQLVRNVLQQLQIVIEQVLERNEIPRSSNIVMNVIVDILNGRIDQQQIDQRNYEALQTQLRRLTVALIGQVGEVTPFAILGGNLENSLTQEVIIQLAQLIDNYRQQLQPYALKDLLVPGLSVESVKVDELVTYSEPMDVDLINLNDQQLLQTRVNNLQNLQQKVVAREQRLNHKPFNIAYSIRSDIDQPVVVRTLIGPQIDENGGQISLAQGRQNYVLLDAFVQNLKAGRNMIVRNSRDITSTEPDVSTLSVIYRGIMTGQSLEELRSTNYQLPQRLLLPRGAAVNGGLPMQLLVVTTPITQSDRGLQQLAASTQCIVGLGVATVNLDSRSLDFPLDRQVADIGQIIVPNILLINTQIQYEERERN